MVGIDCRLTVAGVTYEVDAELAGETVVVWWGLFDQELWVEHGEERTRIPPRSYGVLRGS